MGVEMMLPQAMLRPMGFRPRHLSRGIEYRRKEGLSSQLSCERLGELFRLVRPRRVWTLAVACRIEKAAFVLSADGRRADLRRITEVNPFEAFTR